MQCFSVKLVGEDIENPCEADKHGPSKLSESTSILVVFKKRRNKWLKTDTNGLCLLIRRVNPDYHRNLSSFKAFSRRTSGSKLKQTLGDMFAVFSACLFACLCPS